MAVTEPKPVTRVTPKPAQGANTGPGAGGPRESGPKMDFTGWLNQQIGHLPSEIQSVIQQRWLPLGQQIMSHIGQHAAGGIGLHPALDHSHGPDGGMLPPVGMGGLAGRGVPPAPPQTGTTGQLYIGGGLGRAAVPPSAPAGALGKGMGQRLPSYLPPAPVTPTSPGAMRKPR